MICIKLLKNATVINMGMNYDFDKLLNTSC